MGLMKKLTSVVVTAGLLLGLVGTAAAAYPDGVAAAAGRMHDLGLVNGKVQGSSDLQLNDPITRAELVTIIVRAFGKANDAKFLKGAAAFPDTASHWASGEIALAKNMIEANGFSMGMPDGTFAPDAKLTTAQAVAFVMKFLGAPRDASQAWPNDYLNGAVAAGLMSADDKAALEAVANNDANRGLAFYLADEAFYSYKMADGKTVYTEFVKPTAPTVTLDEVAPTTKATATVSGSVSSDATAVYVGSMANQVTVTAGKFSADVDLTMGDNNISVMATDLAGNTTTKTLTITRTVGAAASIDAPATLTVKAGDTVDLAAAVKDADGNTISDAVLTATGDAGTLADGKFTAATKAGSYTLTLTSGDLTATVAVTVTAADLASVAITPATVNLAAGAVQKFAAAGVDQYGNTADLSGVTWSASAGVIDQSGNFAGTGAGNITITATAGAVSGTATATVYGVATALKLSVAGNLTADGSSTITATVSAVDANGNTVPTATNTVDFTSSNAGVFTVAPGRTQLVNGTATVTLTDVITTGSTAFLSATSSGLTGASSLVTAQAQTIGSITLSADPATIGVGSTNHARIKASILDTNGVAMAAPADITVTLTSSNTSIATFTAGNTLTVASGSKSAYTAYSNLQSGNQPGSATVSGVVSSSAYSNIPVTAVTVTTNASTSVAYKLSMDTISSATVDDGTDNYTYAKVRVLDYNGNQVTSDNGRTISFVESSGDVQFATSNTFGGATSYSSSALTNNGAAVIYMRNTTAEDDTVKAFATSLGTVSGTATFTADQPSQVVAYTAVPTAIANDNGASSSALKFKVADRFGNVVTNSTAAITLAYSDSNRYTTVNGSMTQNAVGGYVTFNVKSGTAIGTDTYHATSVGLTDSGNKPVQVWNVGAPSALAMYSIGTDGSTPSLSVPAVWTAGTTYTVKVGVVDGSNANPSLARLVSSDSGRSVSLSVDTGSATIASPTVTTTGGLASFSVTATKTGTVVLRATTSGLNSNTVLSTSLANISTNAGWPVKLVLSVSPSTLANDNVSNVPVKVYTVDDQGNYANVTTGDVAVSLSVDSVTAGGFTSAHNSTGTLTVSNNSNSATSLSANNFFSTGIVGSATITAQAAGFESATAVVNTANVGAATRLAVASPNTVNAANVDVNGSFVGTSNSNPGDANYWMQDSNQRGAVLQKVTASIVDNAGLQVTNGANDVNIKLTPNTNVYMYVGAYTDGSAASADLANSANWEVVGPGAPGTAAAANFTAQTGPTGAVTFYVISKTSGSIGYTASDSDNSNITGQTAYGSFTQGAATQYAVTPTPSVIAANGTSQSLFRIVVQDANGNTVSSYNGTATLTISGPGDLQNTSVSIASGVGSVYVTSRAYSGTVSVTATIDNLTKNGSGSTDLTVGQGAVVTGNNIASSIRIASATTGGGLAVSKAQATVALLPADTLTFTATNMTAAPIAFSSNVGATVTATNALPAADIHTLSALERSISINLGSGEYVITVPAYKTGTTAYANIGEVVQAINDQIAANTNLAGKVQASVSATKITFTSLVLGTSSSLAVTDDGTDFGAFSGTPASGSGNVANLAAVTANEIRGLVNTAVTVGGTVSAVSNNSFTVLATDPAAQGINQSLVVGGTAASKIFTATSYSGIAQNDSLKVKVNSHALTAITLDAGTYTVAQLAANLQAKLNAQFTGSDAVTVSVKGNGSGLILTTALTGGSAYLDLENPNVNDSLTSALSTLGLTAGTTANGQ